MRMILGVGLLVVFWSATTTAKPTSLLIIHERSEGSHALVDQLNSYPCTRYYQSEQILATSAALREFFGAPTVADIPAAYGLFESRRQEAVLDPTDVAVRTTELLNHSLVVFVSRAAQKENLEMSGSGDSDAIECACESRGLLVRVDEATVGEWCAHKDELFGDETDLPSLVRVVVLVRIDLLRYAISTYGRIHPNEMESPQFQLLRNPNASLVDLQGRVTYNLSDLQRSVESTLDIWRNTAKYIRRLMKCGVVPILSTYEAFDDAGLPDDFAPSLVADCAGSCEDSRWRAFTARYAAEQLNEPVRKVHSNTVSDYAENAREVLNWFSAQDFPTFAHVAKTEANLNISTLQWL